MTQNFEASLVQIRDILRGGITVSPVAGGATAANQALVLAELATILNEATFTGRVGEVQASPTANTLLARLKDLLTLTVLAGGENIIGRVGFASEKNIATLNAIAPVFAAAGDYAANDVMNNSTSAGTLFRLTNAVRVNGYGGTITKLLMTMSVAGLVFRPRLHVFDEMPTVFQNDNVALLLDLDDRSKYLGPIDIPAFQTSGSSEFSWSMGLNPFPFKCKSDSRDLWIVMQTLDAFTNEAAGMTGTMHALVAQD